MGPVNVPKNNKKYKYYDFVWLQCTDFTFTPWVITKGQRESYETFQVSYVMIYSALFVNVSWCLLKKSQWINCLYQKVGIVLNLVWIDFFYA